MNNRPITFPQRGDGLWVNAETGVRIHRVIAMYFVETPALRTDPEARDGYVVTAQCFRLTHAREVAKAAALDYRKRIAADADYARIIFTSEQVSAAHDAARNADHLTPAQRDTVDSWLDAANTDLNDGAYDRARVWAREAVNLITSTSYVDKYGYDPGPTVLNAAGWPVPVVDTPATPTHPYAWDATPADEWLRMANDKGFYRAAAQNHYNDVYRGNASDTLAALHKEALDIDRQRTADRPACGAEFESQHGYRTTCRRPAGHTMRYNLGHAEVRYPQGTPEYDEYVAQLRPELAKFAAREHPYDIEPPASGDRPHPWDTPTSATQPRFQPGDRVRIARTDPPGGQRPAASLAWKVVEVDPARDRVRVDLVRGSLLGPQWEHVNDVQFISRPDATPHSGAAASVEIDRILAKYNITA